MQVIDRLLVLRLSLLLGYIISISSPFTKVINFLLQPSIFGGLLTYIIEPLWSLSKFLLTEGFQQPLQSIGQFISYAFKIAYEVIYPLVYLITELFKLVTSVVKVVLYTPTMSMYRLMSIVFEGIKSMAIAMRDFYRFIKQFVVPVATNPHNREATMGFLQLCQQIGQQWSASIHKKVIQGAKAVYDFTVYMSGEIGKHRHSLYLAIGDNWARVCSKYRSTLQKVLVVTRKVVHVLMVIFLLRMLLLGTRFATNWVCGKDDLWWDDQLKHTWQYIIHLNDEGH